ncbi:MAG: Holliday junction branch migration protein RuvA [Pseudomonadota bacterium]|nr:Holliday junction branch migration protein RuvA [Gammaproteobacteria bacterium]MBU1558421.1 Holliday junction branch migration protein RuvA [Gammaproteobacteria bacterium]MBU1628524.1 Holliday junction branch migration protein RuvA [Gammaproteobacteria bacterium]MBU1926956.1 Holliday junction branch migration protein RuvA [Gammaproteobacteria bacterium]MBU2545662.1 Holliday junction branch migration protein RuvA [Gammaproteobacteria bacterium]
MIGRLKGILITKRPPELLIDVGGVGYELLASMNTFYHLPEEGETVTLLTQLVVREDAQTLYGFYDHRERDLFRTLVKVSGVGPKMALAILSNTDPDGFVRYIVDKDLNSLLRIPGVGRKTAERLVVEMRDRLNDWYHGLLHPAQQASGATQPMLHDASQDAVSALIALGYKPPEASKAVSKVYEEGLKSEELIRKALKEM